MVYTQYLHLILGREQWDEESLKNHVRVVYGEDLVKWLEETL